MELYLLRHGVASVRDPKRWPDDRQRPLTVDGQEKMREIARGIHKLGIEFEAMFDSGYVRARQTTEAVADAYRIDPTGIKRSPAVEPEAAPEALVAVLKKIKALRSVLVVGHQPHLSGVIAHLVGAPGAASFDFRKGGLCRIDLAKIEAGAGKLIFMLPPRALRKIK